VVLAIALRMQSNFQHYPWLFFWRFTKLCLLLFFFMLVVFLYYQSDQLAFALILFSSGFIILSTIFFVITLPVGRLLKKVESIISAQLPFHEQLRLIYKKDEWAQIEAALDDADVKLREQLKTIQAENTKFTTLLSSISNEILAIDSNQNVLFFNPRFQHTFLHKKEKLQAGGKLWSVLDISAASDLFKEVLSDGQPKKIRGFKVPQNSDIRFYNLVVSPILDEDKIIKGAVGVFSDITEIKLTEQMRADFVANVSHEIRTPLTSIKGFSQVLKAQKDKLPSELQDFVDRILHNTERMIALFNDLLNLSVIESKDVMERELISLHELLDHVWASMKAKYSYKSLTLKQDLTHDEIYVDEKLFYQVLANLLENACKYGSEKVIIQVSERRHNDQTEITIKDNGPGIPPEHLSRIFERFYRVDHARDRESGGTGLGLAIVKHIIVKHGGQISVHSDGISGCEFTIKIPFQKN
jgi:two-component system, OmpR family, phosphate regulon sensor histidine kinase PhoR